ncbi:hypothetical protein B0H14DRAFT_3575906 [Mycena olivaceomarginata]|nr:hypothetical protein B0H14DRAFT_3575906 [Mycena olivaceomarginata]
MPMLQQSQRGQSYTMSTQEEWLTSLQQGSPAGDGLDLLSLHLDAPQLAPVDFADSISNTLGLNPKYRADVHTFVQLLGDHPRTESIPMIYVLATNLYTQQLILDSRTDYAKIGEVLADVKLALSHNLDLTKEQRIEVTASCKRKAFDPKRTDFDNDSIRLRFT